MSLARLPTPACRSGAFDVKNQSEPTNQLFLRDQLLATSKLYDAMLESVRLQFAGGPQPVPYGAFFDPALISVDVQVRNLYVLPACDRGRAGERHALCWGCWGCCDATAGHGCAPQLQAVAVCIAAAKNSAGGVFTRSVPAGKRAGRAMYVDVLDAAKAGAEPQHNRELRHEYFGVSMCSWVCPALWQQQQ